MAASALQESPPPAESTWKSPKGIPRAESQARLRASPTSSIIDGRVARPRRWGDSRIRRIASPPTRTFNDTRSSHPPFDATDIPEMTHQYTTSTEHPYAKTSGHLNHDYVFPPGVNTDIVPRSAVTGAFESSYMTAHPSLFGYPQDAERHSVESSMSTYPTPPNDIPSNSHVLSTNLPVGAPNCDWQRACETRPRVDSQSSIAYTIPVDLSSGTRQDTVPGSKLSLPDAKHCYSPPQPSCASSTSSSLDSFFSTAVSYAPSGRITHDLELEAGLQIQQYSGTPDFHHSSSVVNPFSSYTIPDDMVMAGELYHRAAHHK
jgi:hypothetical protein